MLKLGLILQNIHFIVKTQAERQIIKLSFLKQKLVYVVDVRSKPSSSVKSLEHRTHCSIIRENA
jgi:hypothetical protein